MLASELKAALEVQEISIVWTQNKCKWCVRAKDILAYLKVDFEERLLDNIKWSVYDLTKQIPIANTVPQIIISGDYVGGYNELADLFLDIQEI